VESVEDVDNFKSNILYM